MTSVRNLVFNINIFSFIAFTDILKLAVIPLLIITLATMIISIVVNLFLRWSSKKQTKAKPISRQSLFIVNLLMGLVLVAIILFVKGSLVWFWLAVWSGAFGTAYTSRPLMRAQGFEELFQSRYFRVGLALLLMMPLFLSGGISVPIERPDSVDAPMKSF